MLRKKNSILANQSIIKIKKLKWIIFKNNSNGLYCVLALSLVSCKEAKANAIPTTVIAEPVDYMKLLK
jgi:hypothetical protein